MVGYINKMTDWLDAFHEKVPAYSASRFVLSGHPHPRVCEDWRVFTGFCCQTAHEQVCPCHALGKVEERG